MSKAALLLRHARSTVFFCTIAIAALVSACGSDGKPGAQGAPGADGANGANGADGARGPAGPTMPVLQSLSAEGLPASPGGTVTIRVAAQSAEELTLTYAWTVAHSGWSIQSGAASDTVTIVAPNSYAASGTATVTITDTEGRSATGMVTLSTVGNTAPVIHGLSISRSPARRNQTFEVLVSAADPNGDALTYAWTVPAGIVIEGGQGSAELVARALASVDGLIEVVVSDGDGGSATSKVHVSASDGAWGVAQLVELDNVNSLYPQIGVDTSGRAVAVWQALNGARYDIWANHYAPGVGWGTPELLETDNAGSAAAAQVALAPNGNAIAVWSQSDGLRSNIWANYYLAGMGWDGPKLIESDNAGDATYPQAAIDGSGAAIAVWSQSDGVRTNIWTNHFSPDAGWGAPALLETNDAGHAANVQIAMDAGGNAIAVWQQSDGVRYNAHANRYVAGTGWGGAVLLETEDGGDAGAPSIAIDPSGNAIAAWSQHDGSRSNAVANHYVVGAGWSGAVLLETDDDGNADAVQIAMEPSGGAVVVWKHSYSSYSDIWANRYAVGSGWSGSVLLDSESFGSAVMPQVAVDASGNAIAVWYQDDGVRTNIWANRFVPGAGWGDASRIETSNAGHAAYPQVAMTPAGAAIAVWQQYDGVRNNITANHFQ